MGKSGGTQLVEVEPRRLRFVRPGDGKPASPARNRRLLRLKAPEALGSGSIVAFKLQTNASRRFNVQPAQGYLRGGESREVIVQLKHGTGWAETDKFLVRAAQVTTDRTPVQAVWEGELDSVQKIVVRCDYVAETAAEAAAQAEATRNGPRSVEPPASLRSGSNTSISQRYGGAHSRAGGAQVSPNAGRLSPRAQVSARHQEMLRKNLSSRPEDRLSREELEELQRLREQVGTEMWHQLQDQARATLELGHQLSPHEAFARSPIGALAQAPTNRPGQASASYAAHSLLGKRSVAELLEHGVQLLREQRTNEAIQAFSQALNMAPQGRVERAQVLVGLGSGYEAAGLVDRALDCYTDAIKLYDRLGDLECKESVASAIAHVYADMRDHTMSAAWFDYELELLPREPADGERRAAVQASRDRQMRLGHVSSSLLAAARGRVAAALAAHGSRPGARPAGDALSGVGGAIDRVLGTTRAVDTLWEPPSSRHHGPTNGQPSPSHTTDTSQGFAPPDENSSAASRPRRKSIGPNSNPHYLAPTTASRAARAPPAPLASAAASQDGMRSYDEPSRPPVAVDPAIVERRTKASSAAHVRRALEARRKRDQERGVRPPAARRSRPVSTTASTGATAGSHAEERAREDLLVEFVVHSRVDGQTYSVALPGPLSTAQALSVREMRERVAFVTGVELHDFDLVVEGTPLADSWLGQDFGLEQGTEVELVLVPGVRISKYSRLALRPSPRQSQSPKSAARRQSRERKASVGSASSAGSPVPAPPTRRPPAPASPDSDGPGAQHEGSPVAWDDATGDQASVAASDEGGLDPTEATLDELCDSVQASISKNQLASRRADEIKAQADAVLRDKPHRSHADVSLDGEMPAGADQLGAYAAALMERIVALESELTASRKRQERTENTLQVAKSRILDLTATAERERAARKQVEEQAEQLRHEFDVLSKEARASLANFAEVLRQGVRSVSHSTGTRPQLVLVVAEDDDSAGRPRVGSKYAFGMATLTLDDVVVRGAKEGNEVLTDALHDVIAGAVQEAFFVSLGSALFVPTAASPPVAHQSQEQQLASKGSEDSQGDEARPVDAENGERSESGAAQYQAELDLSIMAAQVYRLFDELETEHQATKFRAVALPCNGEGSAVDLLDPDQDISKPVAVGVDADGELFLQNSMAVKFRTLRDFDRLFDVLCERVAACTPCHVLVVLENESTARRLVFVQPHPDDLQAESLGDILSASRATQARAIVLLEQGGPSASGSTPPSSPHASHDAVDLLRTNFPDLVVRRFTSE